MLQLELFEPRDIVSDNQKVVNVSSVPQRSPFRYAGGKTWLIPKIRQWLHYHGGAGKELIEPFAGGGIVSLTAACEGLVDRVTMVEKDEDVAAVWRVILNGGAECLAESIVNFQTYDDDSEVHRMANCNEFKTELIAMKNTHHAKKTELIIGKSLEWLLPNIS
jgi:site-specific DNA-adenine methylase